MFGKLKAPEWKTPPMEIFERQMMVTVEACEETDLKIALEFLPADHVALASDWPHYDGTPDLLDGLPASGGRRAGLDAAEHRDARHRHARALVPRRTEAGVPMIYGAGGQRRGSGRRTRRWCAASAGSRTATLDALVNRVANALAARGRRAGRPGGAAPAELDRVPRRDARRRQAGRARGADQLPLAARRDRLPARRRGRRRAGRRRGVPRRGAAGARRGGTSGAGALSGGGRGRATCRRSRTRSRPRPTRRRASGVARAASTS